VVAHHALHVKVLDTDDVVVFD